MSGLFDLILQPGPGDGSDLLVSGADSSCYELFFFKIFGSILHVETIQTDLAIPCQDLLVHVSICAVAVGRLVKGVG